MNNDREVQVLIEVQEALSTLDPSAARRVLAWLTDKFEVPLTQPSKVNGGHGVAGSLASQRSEGGDFATLFAQAQPQTEKDKALVVGYWFQIVKGASDLDALALNRELRDIGHPISNITKALTYLIRQRPQYVMQIRKSGTAQQARKKYRLTKAGLEAASEMLTRNPAP